MKTVIHIVGARPNFVKAAPIIAEMEKIDNIQNLVVHTGQHYDDKMSNVFFSELGISKPNYNLGVGSGSHATQTASIMIGCEQIFIECDPDFIIVYGDINSCLAAALVASKMGVPIAHVESGLRSYDRTMPEEINRVITDSISNVLFLTSFDAMANLHREGIDTNRCYVVGNTMIDSLVRLSEEFNRSKILSTLGLEKKTYALATFHRPSNVDTASGLEKIIDIFTEISALNTELKILFPIHPRTLNNIKKFNLLDRMNQVDGLLIEKPFGYLDFISSMKDSLFVITDSGGIQEETTFLNVPCLTYRQNTERPVTVELGTNVLVDSISGIVENIRSIMDGTYKRAKAIEHWDGEAAIRVTKILSEVLS